MIAKEDAGWLAFYRISGVISKELQDAVRATIDRYYVTVFDHEADSYYKSTRSILTEAYDHESVHIRKTQPPLVDQLVVLQFILTHGNLLFRQVSPVHTPYTSIHHSTPWIPWPGCGLSSMGHKGDPAQGGCRCRS